MKYIFLCVIIFGLCTEILPGQSMGSKLPSSTPSLKIFEAANSPDLLKGLNADTLPCSTTFQEGLISVRRGREPLVPPMDSCPIQNKTISWLWLQQGCRNPRTAISFLQQNSHWPDTLKIRTHIEKMLPGNLSSQEVISYFDSFPPITSEGALIDAWAIERVYRMPTRHERIAALWHATNFTESDEKVFYQKYRGLLTGADHCKRMNRLMIDGNYYGLTSLKKYVSKRAQKAIDYVVHLIEKKSKLRMKLSSLPEAYESMPGAVYQKMCWLLTHKDFDEIQVLFEHAMRHHIFDNYPDIQARYRNLCVRHLYCDKKVKEAYNFYQTFPLRIEGQTDMISSTQPIEPFKNFLTSVKKGANKTFPIVVEGEFFRGWLALRQMNRPKVALHIFTALYDTVATPISKSKMAYWAGRASRDLGTPEEASNWFKIAAQQPQTYYGQLALKELNLPWEWVFTPPQYNTPTPQEQELLDAARLLPLDNYYKTSKESLLTHLARTHTSPIGDLLVEYSQAIGLANLTVLIARTSGQKNPVTIATAYPVVSLPSSADRLPHIQPAFVYALIRQESMFDPRAISSQGARGLMQMMPKVWHQWLRKMGFSKKSDDALFDPHHNLEAGLHHLSQDMGKFDGDQILVLASYNAGARRAYEWIDKFGDPRDKSVDPVDWVEMIPFEETRGYIQRVLEAVPIYEIRVNE